MAVLVLNPTGLTKLRRLADISDRQLALKAGIHPTQFSRVTTGQCQPGTRFIAGLLTVFGVDSFPDLFTVQEDHP